MGAVIIGRFKRTVSRIISSSSQRAARDYECSNCICPIFAGEEYIRKVHLFKSYNLSGIWVTNVTVRRFHEYCPDDEHERWLEGELEDETSQEETGEQAQIA